MVGTSSWCSLLPACWTQPEELEAVRVDSVPRRPPDCLGDALDAGIADTGRAAARRADDVVVVRRLAGHEGMLARGEIQSLDDAEICEDVQGPEDRRPRHPEPSPARLAEKVVGGEVPAVRGDQRCKRTPRPGQPVPGRLERADDLRGVDHGASLQ